MGINAQIEFAAGECLGQFIDPFGQMNWLLRFVAAKPMLFLRSIDPFGDTVFNSLQIPVLQSELKELRSELTEANLAMVKREYIRRAEVWPLVAMQDATKCMESLTIGNLLKHLDDILALTEEASNLGPHHYIRFLGD